MEIPTHTGLYEKLPVWHMPQWVHDAGWRKDRGLYSFARNGADLIRAVEVDGIPQVAPICVAMRAKPDVCRAKLGKGLWKKLHHSDVVHNAYRAAAYLRYNVPFADLIHVPTGFLRELNGALASPHIDAIERVKVAAQIAETRTEMRQAIVLVRDVWRMNGQVNPAWSMRRLREEHDRLAWEAAKATASAEEWAKPWSCEVDGYTFTRLVSHLAFAHEGAIMRHCIAGYARDAKLGREVAFKIEGPERASVSFSKRHVEIKGRYNAAVKERTKRAAMEAWAMFRADHA